MFPNRQELQSQFANSLQSTSRDRALRFRTGSQMVGTTQRRQERKAAKGKETAILQLDIQTPNSKL